MANTIPLKTISETTNIFQEETIQTYTNQCRTEIAKLLHSFSNNKYKLTDIHSFVDDIYYNTLPLPKFLYILYNILSYKAEGLPDTSITIFLGYLFQSQNYYLNELENILGIDLSKYKSDRKNEENEIETQYSGGNEIMEEEESESISLENNKINISNNIENIDDKEFTFSFDELIQIIENIQKLIPTQYTNPITEGIWNILMNKIQHTYSKDKLDEFLMNLEQLNKCDDKDYDITCNKIKDIVGDSIYAELCKLFILESNME